MFAPKVAKSQAKAVEASSGDLAQRSTLIGQRSGWDPIAHALPLQRSAGRRVARQFGSRLNGSARGSDHEQEVVTEPGKALHGARWDFSKIQLFSPDRPSGRLHVPGAGTTQTKPAIDKPGNGYEQKAEAPEERRSNLVPRPMTPGFHFNFARVPVTLPPIQCKPLEIGAADDPFEREADRVAERVMRTLAGDPPRISTIGPLFAGSQRAAPPIVEEVLEAAGEPLAPATRAFFEPKFGHDFKTIRLHANDRAAKSADAIHARAYTVGDDIVFGRNQYQPETGEGRRLLAHELAHSIQQSGRRHVMREPPTPPPQQRVAHPNVMQDIEGKFTQLYAKLSPKARYRLNRNITIAIGIVTEKSDKEANEPRFVYTLSGNASSKEIDAAADELGLTRWKPSARAEGRGAVGSPNDAEQLLTEGAEANHFDVWAAGVNRRFCPDCAVHMKDAEVPAQAFPDGAFRQGGALYKYQPPAGGGEEGGGEPAVVAPGGQGKQTTPPKTQGDPEPASGTPPTATKTPSGTGAQSEHEGGETTPGTGGAGQTPGMSRASQIGVHIGIGAASVGLSLLAAYLKGRVDAKIAQRQIDAFLHFAGEWINAHPDEALKKMMFAPEVTTYAWVYLQSSVITFFEPSMSPEPSTSDSSPMIDLAGIDYSYKPVDPAMPQNFLTGISGGGRHLTTTRMLIIDIPLVTPSVEDMFEYAKSRNIWLGGLRDYVMYRLEKSLANLELAIANFQMHRGTQQDIDKATLQNRYWQNMADQILGAEKQQVTAGH
jgi:hypothetical protein